MGSPLGTTAAGSRFGDADRQLHGSGGRDRRAAYLQHLVLLSRFCPSWILNPTDGPPLNVRFGAILWNADPRTESRANSMRAYCHASKIDTARIHPGERHRPRHGRLPGQHLRDLVAAEFKPTASASLAPGSRPMIGEAALMEATWAALHLAPATWCGRSDGHTAAQASPGTARFGRLFFLCPLRHWDRLATATCQALNGQDWPCLPSARRDREEPSYKCQRISSPSWTGPQKI